MNPYVHVFAVMRHDLYAPRSEIRNAVTIVALIPTEDEAQREVDRLSRINPDEQSEYYLQSARYYPEGRDAGD